MNDIDELSRKVYFCMRELDYARGFINQHTTMNSKTTDVLGKHDSIMDSLQTDMKRAFDKIVALEEHFSIFMKLTENKSDEPQNIPQYIPRFIAGEVSTKNCIDNLKSYLIDDSNRHWRYWNGRIQVYSGSTRLRDRIIELLNKYGVGDNVDDNS
jgi:hypothetical protein